MRNSVMRSSSGRAVAAAVLATAVAACGKSPTAAPGTPADTARVALTDMGSGTYLGFAGGLYPDGADSPPADHAAVGAARVRSIRPLDVNGEPNPSGKYVLLSVGMSNTTQEFCSRDSSLPCDPWTFMGQAATDPEVDHDALELVNGALGGRPASAWDSPTDPDYDRVRDTRLVPRGLSEAQVQIAWLKVANPGPRVALPSEQADAYALLAQLGDIVRALKTRYPNLQQVFVSSRTYGGYATTGLNPEPYAYESGFAVKWLVQAQIEQMRSGGAVDPRAGDLDYGSVATWLGWGPYLWADGLVPRSDGLTWELADFQGDGTHPSRAGEEKVGTLLLEFFETSPFTRCWFIAGQECSA